MTSLRLPFVMTVGVSTAAACGGSVLVDAEGEGGAATGTGGGTTQTTGVGGSSSVTSTGTSSNPPPPCPLEPPNGYSECLPSGPTICSYDVSCQSGTVNLSFECVEGAWSIVPEPCDYAYDSCPGTEYYCANEWTMPTTTNPPSPCPETLPEQGTTCFTGGMGGVWPHCGYACGPDPATSWVVASCVGPENEQGIWQHDQECLD